MAKKPQPKKKVVAPPRRTRTIQNVIEDNKEIVSEKLGSRRSVTDNKKVVPPKKVTPVKKAIKKTTKKTTKKATPVKKAKDTPKNKNLKTKDDSSEDESSYEDKEKKPTSPVAKASKKATTRTSKAPVVSSSSSKKAQKKEETPKKKETPRKKETPKKKTPTPAKAETKKGKKAEKTSDKVDKVKVDQPKQGPRRTESKATAGIVDIVFCCDTTGSMGSYLEQSKSAVKEICKNIKDKAKSDDISVRFGFVCYRDHPPQDTTYVTLVHDLGDDDEVIEFIKKQSAQGGGDAPEAVLDGLYDAAKKINWRDSRKVPSLRYIFHIADAPPHGEEFGIQSQWSKGVPSGINLDKVAHVINIREIHYRLIKPTNSTSLEKMQALFKEKFTNYEETDLTHAKEMNIKISDMIIRELCPDVDYDD